MSEHKKCPFCGGKALIESVEKVGVTEYFSICTCCAAEGPWHTSEAAAWAAWNRRDAAAVKELAELLKEAHEHVCDLCCPSTGKAGTPIKHGDLCKRIQQAIEKVEGL